MAKPLIESKKSKLWFDICMKRTRIENISMPVRKHNFKNNHNNHEENFRHSHLGYKLRFEW